MPSATEFGDDAIDQFMAARGLDVTAWERDHEKKRCPDCGGINDLGAAQCSVCGWAPE